MSCGIDGIFAEITNEMTRALKLANQGKFAHTPAHFEATDLESAAILTEEVAEVNEEVITLLAAITGMQRHHGAGVRTVNDIEQILWRWKSDSPEKMDSACRENLLHLRCKLREELTQVAAVAVSWILRLDEEEERRLEKIRDDIYRRSEA